MLATVGGLRDEENTEIKTVKLDLICRCPGSI